MKHFIIALLCSVAVKAQTSSNISIVSAEKLNVVYRGVPNPIRIAVPGAKSFTATAPGFVADSLKSGHYIFRPGSGNEVTVKIEAVMEDGSVLKEEKVFKIKGLPAPTATLYGQEGFIKLTKQKLLDAVVEIELIDFLFDVHFEVSGFSLLLPKGKRIDIQGKTMTEDAVKAIKKLGNNDEIIIDFIKTAAIEHKRIAPIVIEISDKKE